MSKKATEFQRKAMSWMYRGKEIFKPLNTGWIDENVACVREWVANIFFYRKGDTTIMAVSYTHLDVYKRQIKFRVTAEEKASLELTCKLLNLSLSTFIRRAIHNVKIEKTVIVAGGGEETLTAVSTLLAQCSKVGGNLNQLARHFNSGGADTEQIRAKLLDELADLTEM